MKIVIYTLLNNFFEVQEIFSYSFQRLSILISFSFKSLKFKKIFLNLEVFLTANYLIKSLEIEKKSRISFRQFIGN